MAEDRESHCDIDVLNAACAGDAGAFGTIVERHQALALGVAYSATRDFVASQDIAQESFLVAWTRLSSLKDPAKFRAWLAGIVRNVARSWRRRERRHGADLDGASREVSELPTSEATPLQRAMARQNLSIAGRALEALPSRYREPLVLYYALGESYERVAASLDLSESAVRQRLCRARKRLRNEVASVEAVAVRCRKASGVAAAVLSSIWARQAMALGAPRAGLGHALSSSRVIAALSALGSVSAIVCALAIAILLQEQGVAEARAISISATAVSPVALEPVTNQNVESSAITPLRAEVEIGRGRVGDRPERHEQSTSPLASAPVSAKSVIERRSGRIKHGPAVVIPESDRPLLRPSLSFGEFQRDLYRD